LCATQLAEKATTGRVRAILFDILDGERVARNARMQIDAAFNELTHNIIGAAIDVHDHIGPGLLKSSYLPCLQFELALRKIRFETQRSVPLHYKGFTLGATYRIDLVVEDLVVVELKSVDRLQPVHEAQLLTYRRLTNSPAGLLINFNVARLVDGVKRLTNARYVGLDGDPVTTA
jgi:GxxExxY protein